MEILSPAGSFNALQVAVRYGADAVYVGGARFSARKNAQNFSDEELASAVDFCHLRGVKLYLCCNTLMKENELDDAMDFVRYAYTIGVDALIVQDLGLISRVRKELPDFSLHASTQMTTVDSHGVNQLAAFGMRRVVLARELSKEQIAQIKQNTQTELEVFVHGALCISYSGQCLMSSILGGRSGNRGACAQPCRLPYTLLKDGKAVTEKSPLLCPKDLCLAGRIEELKDLGVTSLKIEGRMKSPEYVAMVTRVYKNAVNGQVCREEIEDMLKFFSRGGSSSGYFDGVLYGAMMDMGKGSKIADSLPDLPEETEKKMPVSLSFTAKIGGPVQLIATAQGACYAAEGGVCEKARTAPTEKERIEKQLSKLGETPFYAERIEIATPPDGVVAIKEINALRRKAAEGLAAALAATHKRTLPTGSAVSSARLLHKPCMELSAEVRTREQLEAAVEAGIKRIYLPPSLWAFQSQAGEPVLQFGELPKEGELFIPEKAFARACVQNMGQIPLCKGSELTAGHRMNITNSETLRALSGWGISRGVLSPELHLSTISAIRKHTDMQLETIAYGRLPLMLLEHCVIKSTVGCQCESGSFALLDRKNEKFPILPRHCGNVIYNAKPLYMADRLEELRAAGLDSLRLLFTIEDGRTTASIIKEYQRSLAGENIQAPDYGFTRGHFYRGMQ